MGKPHTTIRSGRLMALAAIMGWRPLEWAPPRRPWNDAGLRMLPPPGISREEAWKILCSMEWGINESGWMGTSLAGGDAAWSEELRVAYEEIEAQLGPRPMSEESSRRWQRREVLIEAGLDEESIVRKRDALLKEKGLI